MRNYRVLVVSAFKKSALSQVEDHFERDRDQLQLRRSSRSEQPTTPPVIPTVFQVTLTIVYQSALLPLVQLV